MDFQAEYRSKLRTPAEAVRAVKNGDWVDYTSALGFPPLRFRLRELRFQIAALFAETLELVGAREDSGAFSGAAAGHRAAGMDDLSVQRHDAEAVPVPPGDGDAAVDVLDHDRPPQQVLENAVILPVIAHKAARDADKARLLLQPLLAQGISAHGAHREERRAAAVALL